jgi:L-cystine uptake protein TcyP (sodium:dicarboxylate symporter family)
VLISLIGFVALLVILVGLARKGLALSTRVLLALVLGLAFGSLLQAFYGSGGDGLATVLSWTNLVGSAYVSLLKVIIMPLILVAMIAAVLRLEALSTLGRVGGSVLAVLLGTTLIAAMIGGLLAAGFNLSVDGLVEGERELARAAVLVERQDRVADLSVPALLVSFLPTNIFSDLAESRPTSIIAVVIFAILIGIAGLRLRAVAPEEGQALKRGIDIAQDWVMHLVRLVIALTPYGVLALMTKVAASSDSQDIWNLLEFIAVSYLAIFLMFGVHGLLVSLTGLSPIAFFKKASPALVFAFTSRSSAATIPLNIETQVKALGNHPSIASLSASFGATIGQNGCAGIYPAMLAVMIAPSVGLDPLAPEFFLMLMLVVTISSFGIAGVGGGATFAALVVLPTMGLPVTLVALLISIEPLIDMARTALNVSGSMTAGTLTQRWLKLQYDQESTEGS